MRYLLALALSALPMLTPAQVEKFDDLQDLGLLRIVDEDGPDNIFISSNNSAVVGSHLIYRAHVHRNFNFVRRETWIIDPAGNRRVEPDWGELYHLGNGQWLVEQQAYGVRQIYGLDPQTLERSLLFPAPARLFGPPQNGRRLVVRGSSPRQSVWSTDGTLAGSEQLLDSVYIGLISSLTSFPAIQALEGKWVILTTDQKIYLTDGTRAGTRLLRDFSTAVELVGLTPQQAILHFNSSLWGLRYEDGELYLLYSFAQQNIIGRGDVYIKANLNGRVLFVLDMLNTGLSLWSTDGTFEGTQFLAPIRPSTHSHIHNGLAILGDKAYYFSRHRFDTGGWETDGTRTGTRRFAPHETGIHSLVGTMPWNDERVFVVSYGLHQYAGLWMLDTEGQLTDCTPWPGYGAGLRPAGHGNQLVRAGQQHVYFQAYGQGVGRELHRTNRHGHTELVADLSPGVAWSDIVPIGQAGPWFYFVLNHAGGGASIYRVRDDQPIPPAPPAPTTYTWQQGFFSLWHGSILSPSVIGTGLTSGADGSVYVSGVYNSHLGLAATNAPHLTTPEDLNVPADPRADFHAYFIAKLDGEDGQPAWLKTLDNAIDMTYTQTALAAAPGNGVYFSGSVPSPFTRASLLRIDSTGQELWRLFGSIGTRAPRLATDAEGNLFAVTWLRDAQALLGGQAFDNPHQLQEKEGRWGLAKIRPDGTVAWGRQLKMVDIGNQHNALNAIAIGKNGAIYIAYASINAPGSSNNCGEEDVTAHILLTCLGPDGTLRWERSFTREGIAVPTDLAINHQGLLLLSGFATGDLRLGSFLIESECNTWHSFVLTLSVEGNLLSLNRAEGDEPVVYAIAANESGGYAAAGMVGRYPIHIPYPGLAGTLPYGNSRFREFFLRLYSEQHELLDEKRWYQVFNHLGPVSVDQSRIRLAHLRGNEFIFQHPYSGPLDTFAHSPVMFWTGHMAMRLSMDEPPPAPLIEEGELRMSQVVAFPNPAIDVLTLHSLHPDFKTAQFHLFNSLGQPVGIPDIAAFGPYRYLDVSKLPTGVYFLGIRQGKGWETLRVVVQR
jgi:ELWxxDGT repeat protein